MLQLLLVFMLLGLVAIFRFQSIFLKIILGVFWYPLVTMYLYCIGHKPIASLWYIGRTIHRHYCVEAFTWALLGYFVLLIVVWKLRDYKFRFERMPTNELARTVFVLFFLFVAVIAFPKAFGIGSQRWNLLPGPWQVIFIAMNLILFQSYTNLKQKSSWLHLIILLVAFARGERATSALVLLLFFFFVAKNEQWVYERKMKIQYYALLAGVMVVGIVAQANRSNSLVSVSYITNNLISLATVADVVHIYFSAFSYINRYSLTIDPAINEIASMFNIPVYGGAGGSDYNFTEVLRDYIDNYGGGLFYTEGVLIFGKIGVLIYAALYGLLIRFLYLNNNKFSQIVMLVFIVLQMRIQWYGFVYIYTPIWLTFVMAWCLENLNRIKQY